MNHTQRHLPLSYFFTGQFQHLLLLACLIPGAYFLAKPALGDSTWWGMSDQAWFFLIIANAVIHQVAGWFVFRAQLMFSLLTRLFGKKDLLIWGILFIPLLALRLLLFIGLAISDTGSLGTEWRWLQILLGLMFLFPVGYTAWSVKQYFGSARTLGGDHFREEYRQMPLVTKGIFRYHSNAMYTFAFLLFWSIALLSASRAALAAALFQHAYIWLHMYCTEEPDMRILYGQNL